MIQSSESNLIKNLESEGLVFKSFELISAGCWDFDDADWNYKDIPHLKYIHKLVENHPAYATDDIICSIALQKIPPFFVIPMTLTNYDFNKDTQIYYSSILFWIIVVSTKIKRIEYNNCEVITTYHIGSSKIFTWAFHIIKWLISRNYRDLMSGDIPMRERRGYLRSKGFNFKKKHSEKKYTFLETAEIGIDKVIIPADLSDNILTNKLSLKLLYEKKQIIVGDDISGLLVIANGNKIHIYDRICLHEGALLGPSCFDKNMNLICPWHGRIQKPRVILDNNKIIQKSDDFSIVVDHDSLIMHYKLKSSK